MHLILNFNHLKPHHLVCTICAVTQQQINQVWALFERLPLYSELKIQGRNARQFMGYLRTHPDEMDDMLTDGTERNRMFLRWMRKLTNFPSSLHDFQRNATWMLDEFFEDLPSRKPMEYAKAYGRFFLLIGAYDTVYCGGIAPGEKSKTCRKVGAHRTETKKNGTDFVRIDFASGAVANLSSGGRFPSVPPQGHTLAHSAPQAAMIAAATLFFMAVFSLLRYKRSAPLDLISQSGTLLFQMVSFGCQLPRQCKSAEKAVQ